MKIIIEQPGLIGMTGKYCDINFVDGVSQGMFSPRDMRRVKSLIQVRILTVEEYEAEQASKEAEAKVEVAKVEETKSETEPKKSEEQPKSEKKELVALYNKEELEAIADENGIAGLRELGDKHGIKGRSISELIEELLEVKVEAE